jgi:hypothetical protein
MGRLGVHHHGLRGAAAFVARALARRLTGLGRAPGALDRAERELAAAVETVRQRAARAGEGGAP